MYQSAALRGAASPQIQRIKLRQEAPVTEEIMNICRLSTSWWQPGVKTDGDAEFVPRRSSCVSHTRDCCYRRPGFCNEASTAGMMVTLVAAVGLCQITTGVRTAATEDDRLEVMTVAVCEKRRDALCCTRSTLHFSTRLAVLFGQNSVVLCLIKSLHRASHRDL